MIGKKIMDRKQNKKPPEKEAFCRLKVMA